MIVDVLAVRSVTVPVVDAGAGVEQHVNVVVETQREDRLSKLPGDDY